MFGCLGVSYRTATSGVRDRVTLAPSAACEFRTRLAERGIRQSVVLSTCNRCEVFYWCADSEDGPAEARRLFSETFADVPLDGALAVRTGDDALVYLFRIAAGLESMILGEYQILGQVKEAHAASLKSGHAGRELDRILRDAVTCAKQVKTELDIGAVPPSVCQAGMEHVNRIAGIAGKRVFVIGSGRTGTLAAKLAKRFGAASIAVCNRSPERTRKLVEEVGATAVDYAARYAQIAESDIVVSATASPHVVVRADLLSLGHPVVFLDLASPRDIEPSVAESPPVTLVSVDTIGELAAGDRQERERLTTRGMEIVTTFVAETQRWLQDSVCISPRPTVKEL